MLHRLLAWAPHLAAFGTGAGPYFDLLKSLLGSVQHVAQPAAQQPSLGRQPSR